MNENNFNTSNTTESQKTENGVGALIGSVIIILIIIAGAFYLFSTIKEKRNGIQNTSNPTTEEIQTQNTSDEVTNIEADLEATDIDSLDAELGAIESAF